MARLKSAPDTRDMLALHEALVALRGSDLPLTYHTPGKRHKRRMNRNRSDTHGPGGSKRARFHALSSRYRLGRDDFADEAALVYGGIAVANHPAKPQPHATTLPYARQQS